MLNAVSPEKFKVNSALHAMAADKTLPLKIRGQCMTPVIQENSVVYVKKNKFYWPGDIVAVGNTASCLLAHRLIGIYYRNGHVRYLTQADNAAHPDPPISCDCILGRVTGGDTLPSPFTVPWRSRIKALWNFTRFLAGRVLKTGRERKR